MINLIMLIAFVILGGFALGAFMCFLLDDLIAPRKEEPEDWLRATKAEEDDA